MRVWGFSTQETLMVDISTPRTPVAGGQLAPVDFTPVISLPGTPRSEAARQMYQTVARWGMELEAEMRQVTIVITDELETPPTNAPTTYGSLTGWFETWLNKLMVA
eukprot:6303332-Amphidinium_carterae.2